MAKSSRFTVRLTDWIDDEVKMIAKEEESSRNRIINIACKCYVEKWKKALKERKLKAN